MQTTKTIREIIICTCCKGTGKARFKSQERGVYYETCPPCNGAGRVKQITTINYEKIK